MLIAFVHLCDRQDRRRASARRRANQGAKRAQRPLWSLRVGRLLRCGRGAPGAHGHQLGPARPQRGLVPKAETRYAGLSLDHALKIPMGASLPGKNPRPLSSMSPDGTQPNVGQRTRAGPDLGVDRNKAASPRGPLSPSVHDPEAAPDCVRKPDNLYKLSLYRR